MWVRLPPPLQVENEKFYSMKKILIALAALIGLFLIGFFSAKGVENRAIAQEETIENASSAVEASEKRRFDLIPNLEEAIKAYDEHEYKTLNDLAEARSGNSDKEFKTIQNQIDVVVERYPDLKSQKNYQDFMNELSVTENKLLADRKTYNKEVTRYNRLIRQFPSKQFLALVGYEPQDYQRLVFENNSVDAPKVHF